MNKLFDRLPSLDYAIVFALFMTAVVLALQLLLCRLAKRRLLRLLPVAVLAICCVVFSVLSAYAGGWDGFGYLYFVLLSFWLLIVSAFILAICPVKK